MRIAAIQMRSGTDLEANLEAAGALIRRAADGGASFVATPEMTHILQRSPKRLFAQLTPQSHARTIAYFSDLAKELSIDLLIGSLAVKTGPARAANRAFLFDKTGKASAQYDKIHLFDAQVSRKETWRESNVYDRGEQAVLADIDGAKLGLSICYDLRFGALYRHYAQRGAQIMAVPAAFTVPTGLAHWEPLLRARAIETGSFIIAPAQGGAHEDGRTTWGRSMIVGPWGDIIAQSHDDAPAVITADIDIEAAARARQKIPAWNHNPAFS